MHDENQEQTRAATDDPSVVFIPDATNLSWVAETADGFRDVDLALYVDEQKKLQLMKKSDFDPKPSLATIRTPKHRPRRIPVIEVACRGKYKHTTTGQEIIFEQKLPSEQDYDAVFWTESAIEKFLYPYYRAHRLWDVTMDRLKEQFERDDYAIAIAHRAPSKSSVLASSTVEVGVVKDKTLTWMTVDNYLLTAPRSLSNGSRAK